MISGNRIGDLSIQNANIYFCFRSKVVVQKHINTFKLLALSILKSGDGPTGQHRSPVLIPVILA